MNQSVGRTYKVDICRYLVFVGSLTDAFWHLWTRFAINQAKSTEYAIKSTDWEHVVLSLWKCCWPSCQDGLSRDWTTFMRQKNWIVWNAQIPCPCEYLALLDLLARAGFGWYTRWCIFFIIIACWSWALFIRSFAYCLQRKLYRKTSELQTINHHHPGSTTTAPLPQHTTTTQQQY